MANNTLFLTSLLMLLAHLFLCIGKGPLGLFYIFGTITSVMNHALTNAIAKASDRLTMLAGFGIDIFLIFFVIQHRKGIIATLVGGAALCCFVNTTTHVLAHFLVTVAHAYSIHSM